ncbi:hypothetical protein EB815_03790 [Mesorhizobium loti]|nr:hypothetical protein EB815_03790 [Mesorhizobium loti]
MISAVVKSRCQGGLPKLGHIVRNSIGFIKERVSLVSEKQGIFSQKFQGREHRTPPDRSRRHRAAIRWLRMLTWTRPAWTARGQERLEQLLELLENLIEVRSDFSPARVGAASNCRRTTFPLD